MGAELPNEDKHVHKQAARLVFVLYHRDQRFNDTFSGLYNRLLFEVLSGRLDHARHLTFLLHMSQCMGERGSWLDELAAWPWVALQYVLLLLTSLLEVVSRRTLVLRGVYQYVKCA